MQETSKNNKTAQLGIGAVMRSALSWWNKLSGSQQRTYEMQMFGRGEWWEDNTLCNADILKMYQHYA